MNKNSIIFILLIIMCLAIAALPACSNSEGNNDAGESSSEEGSDVISGDINQSGVNLAGSVISWANMKIDNPDLQLTDEQKMVLNYFDEDYLKVWEYDNFQRYPKAFRNVQVYFQCFVLKVLNTSDNDYECLVAFNDHDTFGELVALPDGVNPQRVILPEDFSSIKKLMVIKGKQNDSRIIQGDALDCYGRYLDVQEYEIDGKTYQLPTISINYYGNTAFYYDVMPLGKYNIDYIKEVGKIFFGGDIKLREPDNEDCQAHSYSADAGVGNFYVVTPDKQINANFESFFFGTDHGFVEDSKSTEQDQRSFHVAADFEHYIVTIYNKPLKLFYMEYYDRDLNKIWGREFSNVEASPYDYTTKSVFLAADTDLYIIDIETGEDVITPVLVGQKVKVVAVEDGVILIGRGNKDNVMKTDREGNILWKTSVDIDVTNCDVLQIIDGNIVTSLTHYEYELINNEEVSNYPSMIAFIIKTIVVGDDGEIILNFIDNEYDSRTDTFGTYTNETAGQTTVYATVIPADGLNLRVQPSSDSQSQGVLLQGSVVEVLDSTSNPGWAQVKCTADGSIYIGYVAIEFLSFSVESAGH